MSVNSKQPHRVRAADFIKKVRAEKWADVEKLRNRKEAALFGEVWAEYLPEDGSPGISAERGSVKRGA